MTSNNHSGQWWPPQPQCTTQNVWQNSSATTFPSHGSNPLPINNFQPSTFHHQTSNFPAPLSYSSQSGHNYQEHEQSALSVSSRQKHVNEVQSTFSLPHPSVQKQHPQLSSQDDNPQPSVQMAPHTSYVKQNSQFYPCPHSNSHPNVQASYLSSSENMQTFAKNDMKTSVPQTLHPPASNSLQPTAQNSNPNNVQTSVCASYQHPNNFQTGISPSYPFVSNNLQTAVPVPQSQPPSNLGSSCMPQPPNYHQSLNPSHNYHSNNFQAIVTPSQTFVPNNVSASHTTTSSTIPPALQSSCPFLPNSFQPTMPTCRPHTPNNLPAPAVQTSHLPPINNLPPTHLPASNNLPPPNVLSSLPHAPNNFPSSGQASQPMTVPTSLPVPNNILPASQFCHSLASNNLNPPQVLPHPSPFSNSQQGAISMSSQHNYLPSQMNQVTMLPLVQGVSVRAEPEPPGTTIPVSHPLPMATPFMISPLVHASQQPPVYSTIAGIQQLSKEEADDKWLENWMASKMKQPIKSKEKMLTVFEFRSMLKTAFYLTSELDKAEVLLSSLTSLDVSEEVWESKLNHALRIKKQLMIIKKQLFEPSVISHIKLKLQRIKKKREYLCRRREERSREKREREQERAKYISHLNRIQEKMKEKALQKIRENELKKEADDILSEVRKKIYETKKIQEKIRILEKLRQIRKENSQKKGLHISAESDENFKQKIADMKSLMLRQLADYNAEEKALQVMLETEQEGQREREAARRMERVQQFLEEKQQNIEECLFGDADIPTPSDPMILFWQHYSQAEHSIDRLLHIRHQWDMFLVPSSSSEGSTIPDQWVTPESPSDSIWASALEKN